MQYCIVSIIECLLPFLKYSFNWKRFAEHKTVQYCGIETVMGEKCHVVKNNKTRLFLAIKVDNDESFTGYQLSEVQDQKHIQTGIIGQNYKN